MLLYLEKYSVKDAKLTYIMIPRNHHTYTFPLNLEDRVKYILQQVKDLVEREFEYVVNKENKGIFEDIKNLRSYTIEIKTDKYINDKKKQLEKLGFIVNKSKLVMTID